MTELEKAFLEFREGADEKVAQLDDILQEFFHQYTEDKVGVKWDTLPYSDFLRFECHNSDGNSYFTYYEHKHLVIYAVFSAFLHLTAPENHATIRVISWMVPLESYFIELVNQSILKLVEEAENWETVI